jgi:glyoxylase-like metal-dependent hydrolase (beta-lactamase superfamily II)
MLRYQIIPVTPFQQNCTVFWNEETKKGGIVDPGGDLALLNKFIDEQGIEIEKILVTHGHLDHAGSVKAMADERDISFGSTACPMLRRNMGFPKRWHLSRING